MNSEQALKLPRLIAILRGLLPQDVTRVCDVLLQAGMTAVEVPLNRPKALGTIAEIRRQYGNKMVLGAGTILDETAMAQAFEAGARFMFSPHFDPNLVKRCLALKCLPVPGVATPSEGFAAVRAGANVLKLFPGEVLTPPVVKAWRAVFPEEIAFLPVGGIRSDSVLPYLKAGANGVAIGSWLYRPGVASDILKERAEALVSRIQEYESC